MVWCGWWRRRAPRSSTAVVAAIGLAIAAAVVMPTAAVGAGPGSARSASLPVQAIGQVPNLAGMGWQKVLDENFDGTSIDESVWQISEGHGTASDSVMTRDAVAVGGGNLTLTAYTDGGGHHSGEVSTGGTGNGGHVAGAGFRGAYGYVEAKVDLNTTSGGASALWMLAPTSTTRPFGDPATAGPELDVFEHHDPTSGCLWPPPLPSGKPCNDVVGVGKHWDGFDADHKSDIEVAGNPTATPLETGFHIYSMLWTPQGYRIFIDGIEVYESTEAITYEPEHLIISQYAGGYLGQAVPASYGSLSGAGASTTKVIVDYVRVWQRPVSDVPDQATAANTPLAVPFDVGEFAYAGTGATEPGSVIVTATSSNTTLVPNGSAGLAVSGNGPAAPVGTFQDGGFDGPLTSWTFTGGSLVWPTVSHEGGESLLLVQGGGKATQTITGLRPDTTYQVGGRLNLKLGYTDTNGNGRVDGTEPLTETGDGHAAVDWGIEDVDSTRAGDQPAKTSRARWDVLDRANPFSVRNDAWVYTTLTFTTGPTTTSVELFVDNTAYAATLQDSDLSFDTIWMRPVVDPNRTLAIRPADGQVGRSTITLTARNEAGTTLGTDTFDVTVGAGSLRDGAFETAAPDSPWTMQTGSTVVLADELVTDVSPFQRDRVLRLAQSGPDTVFQAVNGLQGNTRYKVTVTGRVATAGGDLKLSVANHNGASPQIDALLTGTAPGSTQSIEFVTGAASTSADVLLTDWDTVDGVSYADSVRLQKCTSVSSCTATTTTVPTATPPDLATLGPRAGTSGVPLSIPLNLPSGATLTGVSSSNDQLVPDVDVVATGSGRPQVVTATTTPDRTGKTTLQVAYTGAAGSPASIPVVVTDDRIVDPGFERSGLGWEALPTGASIVTASPRSGTRALQINGTAVVKQTIGADDVYYDFNGRYVVGGWAKGDARLTVRRTDTSAVLATTSWTGGSWTEGKVAFTIPANTPCGGCPTRGVPIRIELEDSSGSGGSTAQFDDTYLHHAPAIAPIGNLALGPNQTTNNVTYAFAGRVSPNALWDSGIVSFSSSNPTVVPVADISVARPDSQWEHHWTVTVDSGAATGVSTVTMNVTDPATGITTSRPFQVTVS